LNITIPEVTVTGQNKSKPYRSAYAFNPQNVTEYIQDAIKNRAYNSVTPIGYDLPKVIKEMLLGRRDDNYLSYEPMREALWAKYLGLPTFKY